MSLSPATVALNINELVVIIFSYLDERPLSHAASVSRLWAEIALDRLWRNVDDLLALFSILGPFARTETFAIKHRLSYARHKFSRSLLPSDWANFQRYSGRVFKINYDGNTAKSRRRQLDTSVFEEITRTCPAEVFPNLHTLSWHAFRADMQWASIVLMHPKIKTFQARLHQSPKFPLSAYVDAVINHMPYLTHLDLQFYFPVREVQDELVSLLRGLRRLQRYVTPMYSVTSRIMEELGTLDDLRIVEFREPIEGGNGDRADVENFSPVLHPHAFPAMERGCLSAHLPDITRTFRVNHFISPNLTHIKVHVLAVVPPFEIESFFQVIYDKCPALTELYVDFMISPDSLLQVPAPALDQRPDMNTFRPILASHQLRKFEFRWEYPLNLTDGDMEEFATSLPLLEHFFLNCEPVIELEPPPLTLHALLPFARHCPRLHSLGLYLDASTADTHRAPPHAVPFAELAELRVGVSNIVRVEPVALFLSQLCALGCTLVSGVRWPDAYGIALDHAGILDQRRSRMIEHYVLWSDVAKVLPMVTKARLEERTRVATLEQQLACLTASSREERERSDQLQREVMDLRTCSR